MSDNNIDLEQFRDQLEELGKALGDTSKSLNPIEREMQQHEAALKKHNTEVEKATKELGNSLKNFGKDVSAMGKSAMSGAGSFSTLNTAVDLSVKVMGSLASAIPFVGGALKGLGEAAGDVTKMMIEQFQTGWNAYKDLSDVGLVKSFEDLKDTSAATGLLFQDVNKAVGKYSTDIASFGGSMASGMKKFKDTAYELTEVRKQFNALGIGAAEFTEYQAKYMAQETRTGRIKDKDAKQLAEGTRVYIEELDTLSKLTGLSRKDIQSQRDAALSEDRFASAMANMPKEVEKTFLSVNSMLKSKGAEGLAQGLRDAASGNVTTEAAKAMFVQLGGEADTIIDGIRSGRVKDVDAANMIQEALKKNVKNITNLGQNIGGASLMTQNAAQNIKFANAEMFSKKDATEADKSREANLKGENKQTAALANTEQQLYDTSKNLQLLMTSSDMVTMGMDAMSEGLDALSEQLFKLSGKAMPAEFLARIEERDAIKELNTAKKKEKDLLEYSNELVKKHSKLQEDVNKETDPRKKKLLEQQLEATKREQKFIVTQGGEARTEAAAAVGAAQEKKDKATTHRKDVAGKTIADVRQEAADKSATPAGSKSAGASSVPSAPVDDSGAETRRLAKKGSKPSSPSAGPEAPIEDLVAFSGDSGSRASFEKLDPAFGEKVLAAAKEYNQLTGKKIQLNSAFRDQDKQKALYAKWVEGGKRGKPVAEPGKSLHEHGQAIDIQNYQDADAVKALNAQGLSQKVPNDPVHFQARTGGVFKGPSTGYNVELHGDEIVTPANDGVSKQALNNSIFNQSSTDSAMLTEKFDIMIDKFNTMIELLDDGNDHSKKLVNAMS